MRLYFAILLLLLTACMGMKVRGQIDPTQVQVTNPIVFDLEIQQIRMSHLPSFRHHYDDYLQYSPAALMLGLKAFGYKGRSVWGRMLVSDAFSAGIMAGVVNALKYSVRRMRPDGSSTNSFPSGHTATAFMAATMLHKEYGWKSTWFSVGGYTVATVIGISRVMNNRHWTTDIMAGGAIGVGSVHLGYFLSDLIFKDKYLLDGYERPDPFSFDPDRKYYEAGFWFSRRFVVGKATDKEAGLLPSSGSSAGLSVMIPLIPRSGLAVRGGHQPAGLPEHRLGQGIYHPAFGPQVCEYVQCACGGILGLSFP
ncbi:MAG: phosphatase PAP2 family protein [Candidatus Cryptobacteroides sp.]